VCNAVDASGAPAAFAALLKDFDLGRTANPAVYSPLAQTKLFPSFRYSSHLRGFGPAH